MAKRRSVAGVVGRLGRALHGLHADERATSDVEYILLTAMVVLPLFAVPPLIMSANVDFFDRVEPWVDLPFP